MSAGEGVCLLLLASLLAGLVEWLIFGQKEKNDDKS